MPLPHPLPDNPLRWDGWKNYNSPNPYERLCLEAASGPTAEEIEENCRLLLQWWQKKLPLKNQPSNPMAQLLRGGLDEAPALLSEASALLLNPTTRAALDEELAQQAKEAAVAEFHKLLDFALVEGLLTSEEEKRLYVAGEKLGLDQSEIGSLVEERLQQTGASRVAEVPTPRPTATPASAPPSGSPQEELMRLLRLSGIDEITDDQRDAFCNMGESLGLTGGQAEDIIDEYLEERMILGAAEVARKTALPKPVIKKEPSPVATPPLRASQPIAPLPNEIEAYPPFVNNLGMPMLLIPTGSFLMGSDAPDALENERPVTKVNLSLFYLSKWPVTVEQYEAFDPNHRSKRAPWATEKHPVLYVSALDAARFCEWLSQKEKRRYRLPTEAEWEYAAKGNTRRIFPWGDVLQSGDLANFADLNTNFPWANRQINDGFPQTSPVGSFPKGASPFGVEDLAGNVWEWCLDGLAPYSGRERNNPRGPLEGPRRVYRGGSWKSRIGSLRATTRGFNAPNYAANDVGFRIVCEIPAGK